MTSYFDGGIDVVDVLVFWCGVIVTYQLSVVSRWNRRDVLDF